MFPEIRANILNKFREQGNFLEIFKLFFQKVSLDLQEHQVYEKPEPPRDCIMKICSPEAAKTSVTDLGKFDSPKFENFLKFWNSENSSAHVSKYAQLTHLEVGVDEILDY